MTGRLSRRQALRVLAAAAGLPIAVSAVRAFAPASALHRWDGEALGARASLTLYGRQNTARTTIDRMLAEVDRLDRIFSLFRPDSELSRLNRDGRLDRPSADMVGLLEESRAVYDVSGGAFDPTVQPLWQLYSAHYRSPAGRAGRPPDPQAVAAAKALVDYRAVETSPRRIALARPGMAVTLNGIAQGYITDRIADLLRNEGFEHVVVEMGEIRTLGEHPDGRPWQVGLVSPLGSHAIDRTVSVFNEAVSVSGGYGTLFDETGRHHHIFDPATGESANRIAGVAVFGPRATAADGLSTAIAVAGETAAPILLAAYPGTRALVTRSDGTAKSYGEGLA